MAGQGEPLSDFWFKGTSHYLKQTFSSITWEYLLPRSHTCKTKTANEVENHFHFHWKLGTAIKKGVLTIKLWRNSLTWAPDMPGSRQMSEIDKCRTFYQTWANTWRPMFWAWYVPHMVCAIETAEDILVICLCFVLDTHKDCSWPLGKTQRNSKLAWSGASDGPFKLPSEKEKLVGVVFQCLGRVWQCLHC